MTPKSIHLTLVQPLHFANIYSNICSKITLLGKPGPHWVKEQLPAHLTCHLPTLTRQTLSTVCR